MQTYHPKPGVFIFAFHAPNIIHEKMQDTSHVTFAKFITCFMQTINFGSEKMALQISLTLNIYGQIYGNNLSVKLPTGHC